MFGLGIGELVIMVVIFLIFFGGDKLPKFGSSIGRAINEFKKALENKKDI
jgi:sec-independent protein translocase protein TatA